MTYCPLCGHDHEAGTPHQVFGTPVTQAFGLSLETEPEQDDDVSAPGQEDVAAILQDYQRLLAKEAKAREEKARDMRRYRANVRERNNKK